EAWEEAMWPVLLVVGVAGLLVLFALAGARSAPAASSAVDVGAVADGDSAAAEPSPPTTPATNPPAPVAPPPTSAAAPPPASPSPAARGARRASRRRRRPVARWLPASRC